MNKNVILITLLSNSFIFAGSLDTFFGTGDIVTTSIGRFDFITSCTLQTDSKIVVAGVSQTKAAFKLSTARYNTDGSLDTTYNSVGTQSLLIGTRAEGNSVAIQTDGKIVVGGFSYSNQTGLTVVRYNADGSLDTTFNTTGF